MSKWIQFFFPFLISFWLTTSHSPDVAVFFEPSQDESPPKLRLNTFQETNKQIGCWEKYRNWRKILVVTCKDDSMKFFFFLGMQTGLIDLKLYSWDKQRMIMACWNRTRINDKQFKLDILWENKQELLWRM